MRKNLDPQPQKTVIWAWPERYCPKCKMRYEWVVSHTLFEKENAMPYDPRPASQGGNRGMDELFSRNAPKGKFRVVGVDAFDGGDWIAGDFDTREEAITYADKHGATMTLMHAYDDTGQHIHKAGTF